MPVGMLRQPIDNWYQFVAPVESFLALLSKKPKRIASWEWLPVFTAFHPQPQSEWPDGMTSSTRYIAPTAVYHPGKCLKPLTICDFTRSRRYSEFNRREDDPYQVALGWHHGLWPQVWEDCDQPTYYTAEPCDIKLGSEDKVYLGDDYLVVLRHDIDQTRIRYVL